jgi:LysM repeat protein
MLLVSLAIVANAVAPRTAAAEGGSFRVYVVQAGDSLSMIAAEAGAPLQAVVELNGIDNPDHVLPGTALVIAPAPAREPLGPTLTQTYRVEAGDTLTAIAARFDVDAATIARLNGIADEHTIRIGALLAVPVTAPARQAPATQRHAVQSGETASEIAARYGVSLAALARANQVDNLDRIRIGSMLVIPPPTLPEPPAAVRAAVQQAARDYGLDPYLLLGLAYLESGWQMDVVSSAGAVGMMQLMPETAQWAISDLLLAATNWPHSLADNTRVGAAYFEHLLEMADGDVAGALASYYQGWASAEADGIFEETRQYVDDVLALGERFRALGSLF